MATGFLPLVAWSGVRRRLGSHLLVSAVVALGFGAALGAGAIADITDRAYPDYVHDAHVNQLVVNPSVSTPEIEQAIRAFDGVEAVHSDDLFFASFALTEPASLAELYASLAAGDESWTQVRGSPDGRYVEADRPVVTEGRLASGTREIFVSEEFRMPLEGLVHRDIAVGDEIDLAFWPSGLDRADVDPSQVFQPLAVERVRVVGFGYLSDEVVPTELFPRERALVSPDLARRFACTFEDIGGAAGASVLGIRDRCSTQYRYFSLDIAADPAAAASIRSQYSVAAERLADTIPAEISELGGGYYYIAQERADVDAAVRQMTRPAVAVLVVFGVLAGLVTVTVAGFAMVRLGRRSGPDLRSIRALGATRRDLAVAVGTPLVGCCAIGILGAIAVAAALSRIGPVGRVAVVDPGGGVRLPVRTVVPMSVVAIVVMLVLSGVVAWTHAGGVAGSAAARPMRRSRTGIALPIGRRPATLIGVRSSLGGAARSDVAVLASSVVVVTVTAACVVFGANLSTLASDPQHFAWAWDAAAVLGGGYGDGDPAQIDATLADQRVESYSLLAFDSAARIDGAPLPVVVGFPGRSPTRLPIIAGRMPTGPAELLLGRASADDIGLDVGDEVAVEVPGAAVALGFDRATVVGIGVLPALGQLEADVAGLGRGAYLVADGEPAVGVTAFVGIDLADGVDASSFLTSIQEQLPSWSQYGEAPITYARPVRPPDIVNVGEMRNAPALLGIVLGIALLLGSMLAVTVSVRERRREFAVLRSLGFVRGEIRSTVRWQAITTAVIGLAAGVPLGVVAGRLAWRRFADDIGVVSAADVPVGWLLALGAGIVALTLLAAVVPGRIAARTSPALALRGA